MSEAYAKCHVFLTVNEAATSLSEDEFPQLAIVGAPPFVRGTDLPGQDLELQLARTFPQCALFVEKPVSSGPEDACWRVASELQRKAILVGVGYMLRYSRAVQKMKKLSWWDKTSSGGPIVEQATHFCDLSRYFGGNVSLGSIAAHTVEHYELPGKLTAQRFDEGVIAPENRLPRLTNATWKYTNGAVGALTHVIALHGTVYDTEFEVYADGYRLKLIDPYNRPVLSVRRPGLATEELFTFPGDDPFYSELSTFIDAIHEPQERPNILSSYEDAVMTYEFTWQIRRASDASARAESEKHAVL
ncbi:hypothetical protein AcV7_005872 [Taiwanofungus camphoratus]|nr:hypothetical protein AcV7_005872 [Antrodia cinnamomea]